MDSIYAYKIRAHERSLEELEFIYLYILKTSSTRTVSVEFRFYRSHHYLYQNIYVVKHLIVTHKRIFNDF